MKVLILETPEAAYDRTSDIICDLIIDRHKAVLGLATGGTMLPVYERLVARHRAGLSLAGVTTFNLDEYVGLQPEDPQSYRSFMKQHLFDLTDIDPAYTHLPRGNTANPIAEAADYEAAIAQAGGIDLQLLGIGDNGHIGFNEPTSSLRSRTRVKTLTRETRKANSRFFDRAEDVPTFAITMGIATILDSRQCLLLAIGEKKANAVAAMIEGPLSAICPASALQMHQHVTVVLDSSAASKLALQSYYQYVHPDGTERCVS